LNLNPESGSTGYRSSTGSFLEVVITGPSSEAGCRRQITLEMRGMTALRAAHSWGGLLEGFEHLNWLVDNAPLVGGEVGWDGLTQAMEGTQTGRDSWA